MLKNPLLTLNELPSFEQIKSEHIEPAIQELIQENRKIVNDLLMKNPVLSWEKLILPLEDAHDRLNQAWSIVGHLHAVVDNKAIREAYQHCLPLLSDFATDMGQHQGLFHAYAALEQQPLNAIQQKIVSDTLRDFRLAGVNLSTEDKQRYKTISQALSEKCNQFSNNVLDATQAWHKHITNENMLSGIPEHAIANFRQTAAKKALEGCVITLEFPDYYAVMTYADHRELRKDLYFAYATRASDQGPHAGQFDNSTLMREILQLRKEKAGLLGFENYAELSLATKMASSTHQVLAFLEDLAKKSLPVAKQELADLEKFAKENFQIDQLNAWDIGYFSEKLRQAQFDISQESLRPYFPLPNVLNGLFQICQRLFGIDINPLEKFERWHPDVKLFAISRKGKTIARFYLDLFARENKRGGAWMDECRVRRKNLKQSLQLPIAYLTCNFAPAVNDEPALLSHDEVLTLFHEFGHGLHHMLTKMEYASVSGINGVPWDAVELPSQFLENWCWEKEALDLISGHYKTQEPLPNVLLNKLLNAKNFHAGMQMVRQLEFALFDFILHRDYNENTDIQAVLNAVRQQVAVVKAPEFNRFQHSFNHIFSGGYAAGYYSYKWAEVLSADAFEKFNETGIFNQKTGEEFMQSILEQGGSKDAMDLFVAFRGREPSIDALLKHSGFLK